MRRFIERHQAVFTFVTFVALALAVVSIVRGESTRRIITQSACKEDPRGDECQAIFTASIRNFDHHTACVLARKIGVPCDRRQQPTNKEKHGSTKNPRPSGRTDSDRSGGPSPSQPPGPGSGGDGDGSTQPPTGSPPSPPGPPTDPPPPPPPVPVDPPSQPPPQGPLDSLQSGLNDTVNGAQGAVDEVQETTCKLGLLC